MTSEMEPLSPLQILYFLQCKGLVTQKKKGEFKVVKVMMPVAYSNKHIEAR